MSYAKLNQNHDGNSKYNSHNTIQLIFLITWVVSIINVLFQLLDIFATTYDYIILKLSSSIFEFTIIGLIIVVNKVRNKLKPNNSLFKSISTLSKTTFSRQYMPKYEHMHSGRNQYNSINSLEQVLTNRQGVGMNQSSVNDSITTHINNSLNGNYPSYSNLDIGDRTESNINRSSFDENEITTLLMIMGEYVFAYDKVFILFLVLLCTTCSLIRTTLFVSIHTLIIDYISTLSLLFIDIYILYNKFANKSELNYNLIDNSSDEHISTQSNSQSYNNQFHKLSHSMSSVNSFPINKTNRSNSHIIRTNSIAKNSSSNNSSLTNSAEFECNLKKIKSMMDQIKSLKSNSINKSLSLSQAKEILSQHNSINSKNAHANVIPKTTATIDQIHQHSASQSASTNISAKMNTTYSDFAIKSAQNKNFAMYYSENSEPEMTSMISKSGISQSVSRSPISLNSYDNISSIYTSITKLESNKKSCFNNSIYERDNSNATERSMKKYANDDIASNDRSNSHYNYNIISNNHGTSSSASTDSNQRKVERNGVFGVY